MKDVLISAVGVPRGRKNGFGQKPENLVHGVPPPDPPLQGPYTGQSLRAVRLAGGPFGASFWDFSSVKLGILLKVYRPC